MELGAVLRIFCNGALKLVALILIFLHYQYKLFRSGDREISPFSVNNTSSFVTHDGVIYIANAGSSFMPVSGEVQYLLERRITPNMCGFAVFRAPFNKKDFPTSFDWNGNSYQVSGLVVAPELPRCIRDRNTGTFRTIIPSGFNQ